jgi:hypothetical protein
MLAAAATIFCSITIAIGKAASGLSMDLTPTSRVVSEIQGERERMSK